MAHSIETKTTFAAVNRLFARSTAFDAGVEIEGTDEPFYYLQDMLHSVVALTDDVGVVVEKGQKRSEKVSGRFLTPPEGTPKTTPGNSS